MFDKFKNRSFKDKLRDTAFLIKNSFKVVGRESDLKRPVFKMVALSIFMTTLFFFTAYGFLSGDFVFLGFLSLVLLVVVLWPFKHFFDVRQRADISWLTYNTITGNDISYDEAHSHTAKEKSKLRYVSFIDMAMSYVGSRRSEQGGIKQLILNIVISAFSEVWDLLNNFMVPSVVVEGKELKEVVSDLKSLKSNVPAALAGILGIDLVGELVRVIVFPLYLLGLLLAVGAGWLLASVFSGSVVTVAGFTFSWIPVLAVFYLIFIASGILKKLIVAIKMIYFTIFYTSLTRPSRIEKSMRDQLTHYLLMGRGSEGERQKLWETSGGENRQGQESSEYMRQLSEYVGHYLNRGASEDEIIKLLKSKGHKEDKIKKAIDKTKE